MRCYTSIWDGFIILYWFLLLSTNICNSRFDFDIYSTIQSFRCNRTLISGVSIITGTILKYKRSKAQKVKVAVLLQPLSLQKHMKHLLWKNSNWILQFSPSPPLLLPLPWVPPYWGPKTSSYGPSWCPPSVAPMSYPLTLEGEAADDPHNFRDSLTEPREQGHLLHTLDISWSVHNPCATLSLATAPCSYSDREFIKYPGVDGELLMQTPS